MKSSLQTRIVITVLAIVLLFLLTPVSSPAATPPAGAPIGNQATATYTDANGVQHEVTSNPVVTYVQQVASLALTADGNKIAPIAGQVVYPHTVRNTGNGTDTFTLSVVNVAGTDDFNLSGLVIYADTNGDGLPDNFTAITSTGPLAAGAQFKFVVVGTVPGSVSSGDTSEITVTATSLFNGAVSGSNTDTTTVSNSGVINITKSSSLTAGTVGTTNTYSLTYQNVGNDTATTLTITDLIPAGMTYIANSARWSVSGATALTDAAGGDPAGITYDYGVTTPPRTITAVVASVPPGVSGTITFKVTVDSTAPPGFINNTANYTYDPDGAGAAGTTASEPSNTTSFEVNQVGSASVVVDDNPQQAGDTALDDIVEVPSALQGATVVFSNQVHNVSTGTNTFDITYSNINFPAGTTFGLFRGDATTPLQNTAGSSAPDTGPIPPNGTYTVVLKAYLPPSFSGAAGYTATVTATMVGDAGVTDSVTDKLNAVTANTVDLTNTSALPGAPGAGAGPEAAAVITNTVNPGVTTRFTLYVNNTSGVPDSYNLAASTNSTVTPLELPAGWTVAFKDSSEAVIANTGVLAANGNKLVYADVTVPASATPGQISFYFRALSPSSTAQDIIHDAVKVNTVRSISLAPNNTGQVYEGGIAVFSHTVCNNGNVLEGNNIVSTNALSTANDQAGWTSVIYRDTNGNGFLDGADTVVTDLSFVSNGTAGLSPGECVTLFVKVTAPAGAAVGTVNTTTLTVTTSNGSYTTTVPATVNATDQTTVIPNDVSLTKQQALDANCDGTPETAYTTTDITSGADPGACIRYRILATNTGTNQVTNVAVFDATPAFTTYTTNGPAATTIGSVGVVPSHGSTGPLRFDVGTLTPGQTATNTFGVKIDN